MIQQEADDVLVLVVTGDHEVGMTVAVDAVHVGSVLHQQPYNWQVSFVTGCSQRSGIGLGGRIHAGALLDEVPGAVFYKQRITVDKNDEEKKESMAEKMERFQERSKGETGGLPNRKKQIHEDRKKKKGKKEGKKAGLAV